MTSPSDLASGYASSHRTYEFLGMGVALACMGCLLLRVASRPLPSSFVLLGAFVVGMLMADFISGAVHWACDTWGTPSTPLLGPLAIRTFREHHVDDKAILRHDFVETNGQSIALSVLPASVGLYVTRDGASGFWAASLLAMAVFVSLTSQIHKWAHMDRPPRVVSYLQRARVILSIEHHHVHHVHPHAANYCITVGWLNRPLRVLRFFEALEFVIERTTGYAPRGEL
jgi:ubiquitin-conjugating enzyme E2 variant